MKNTIIILSLATLILNAPLASYAKENTSKSAYNLPTYNIEGIASLPEPLKYKIPAARADYAGMNFKVKFTVTEDGLTRSVRLSPPLQSFTGVGRMSFANQMRTAVAKWRFEPARDKNGNAIAVKVILPVKVVKKSGKATALASLILDTSDNQS